MLKTPPHVQQTYNITRVAWLSLIFMQTIFYILFLMIGDTSLYILYFLIPSILSWGFAGVLLHGLDAIRDKRKYTFIRSVVMFAVYTFLSFGMMFFFLFMPQIVLWVYQIILGIILISTSIRIFRGAFDF
jgi:hypothetical protein